MNTQEAFEARKKRIDDAMALKEPDRVPCVPMYSTFPFLYAGYSMAEVLYDTEKAKDAIRKYLTHFEPDQSSGYGAAFCGQGPMLEKLDPTWLEWAGRPGGRIDKDSIHQYLERAYMEDDEYPDFNSDMGGWIMRKYLPRTYRSMEGFAGLDFRSATGYGYGALSMQFLNPQVLSAVQTLAEVGGMFAKYYGEIAAFEAEQEAMGFPAQFGATTTCAFDALSDSLRGTLPTMVDLMEQPEEMKRAIEQFFSGSLYGALAQAKYSKGRFIFIPLHKGMDGFMSNDQYREFYWDTLKRLVMALIGAGYTPWLYTEGKYNSRLEFLADVPKGKVFVHIEDADMKEVKRIVGPHACISGGMRTDVLTRGTVEQTKDEVKRLLDICAPGGGYIFDVSDTLEHCKVENVEALFETVKTYGKY